MSGIPTVHALSDEAPWSVTLTDEGSHRWIADEPAANGGGARGPTPHELLLSALGACTAMTLRMYSARKGWALQQVEVVLRFTPDSAPAEGTSLIERRIRLRGTLDAQQRERLLAIANKCPIHRVLTGEVRIESSLTEEAP
jgi:putative redox protein